MTNTEYARWDGQLQGCNRNRRKVANNTYVERRSEDAIALRLHQTDILTFRKDGGIVVNSGGWKTSTTKTESTNSWVTERVSPSARADGIGMMPVAIRPSRTETWFGLTAPLTRNPLGSDMDKTIEIKTKEGTTLRVDTTSGTLSSLRLQRLMAIFETNAPVSKSYLSLWGFSNLREITS